MWRRDIKRTRKRSMMKRCIGEEDHEAGGKSDDYEVGEKNISSS
jgi:hypothetical protein